MRDQLAEQLLARVMQWDSGEVARHMPLLQSMAAYKYDEYQRFSPGMRFVESFALWLQQFEKHDERETAFRFVSNKLVFVSTAEINHLVSLTYPDHIRPILLAAASEVDGSRRSHLGSAPSQTFQVLERRCLFLGLSDGARTDVLRRVNGQLSHEQVRLTHELPDDRIESLITDLGADLEIKLGRKPTPAECTFKTVVLLDDFSASGLSYFRQEPSGALKGKVAKFHNKLIDGGAYSRLVDPDAHVIVALYMATASAHEYLRAACQEAFSKLGRRSSIVVVQQFPDAMRIVPGADPELDGLLDKYYDNSNETSSTALGGTDLRYGFAACGLPLVLSHNTPNNSIGLLWADGPKMRPLFPRVTRHKDAV